MTLRDLSTGDVFVVEEENVSRKYYAFLGYHMPPKDNCLVIGHLLTTYIPESTEVELVGRLRVEYF